MGRTGSDRPPHLRLGRPRPSRQSTWAGATTGARRHHPDFFGRCCRSGNTRWDEILRKIRQDGVRLPTHPLTSRREPRSRRGVGCTRHPCRQASLRVSLRRGAGRPHPPAMGALSVIQWCAAPGPVACRQLGPVCQPCASPLRSRAVTGPAGPAPALWPHGRAAKAIRAVFAVRPRREFTGQRPVRS